MKTIVYEGGAGEARSYVLDGKTVTFEVGKPIEVDDSLAAELLACNSTGLTVDEAWIRSIPVFKEVGKGKGSPKSAGEEVGS